MVQYKLANNTNDSVLTARCLWRNFRFRVGERVIGCSPIKRGEFVNLIKFCLFGLLSIYKCVVLG